MLSSQFHLKGFEVMPFASSNQVVGKDQAKGEGGAPVRMTAGRAPCFPAC